MAKIDLKFLDLKDYWKKISVTNVTKDKVGGIMILFEADFAKEWITLDKSTAIKFAKTLRTEINKIQE